MPRDASETRERLLREAERLFASRGVHQATSREITEAAGQRNVSALTYHFGSRPSLLGAVLSEARRRDNLVIAATDDQLGFVPLFRAVWRFYSDEAHDDRIRAFFHLVGLSVYEIEAFQEFVADLDDLAGMLEAAACRDGCTPADAKQQSLLAISCLRGLLLQRLLTPDAEVDAAAERFIATLTRSSM